MAIRVPSIGVVTPLWQSRTIAAVPEYRTAVQNSGGTWQAAVDQSEDDWQAGVNRAAGANLFTRGVAGKSATYVDRAVNIGSARLSTGVQAATNAYTVGMGKVLGVIANVTLPPRNITGSNYGRVSAVGDALIQAKLAGQL